MSTNNKMKNIFFYVTAIFSLIQICYDFSDIIIIKMIKFHSVKVPAFKFQFNLVVYPTSSSSVSHISYIRILHTFDLEPDLLHCTKKLTKRCSYLWRISLVGILTWLCLLLCTLFRVQCW